MHLDEKVLADVACRLLQFYRLETGREGTLDEANRWFAARSFASFDTKGRGEFLEAFLRNKTGDEQREDLMWLLGQDRANTIPSKRPTSKLDSSA